MTLLLGYNTCMLVKKDLCQLIYGLGYKFESMLKIKINCILTNLTIISINVLFKQRATFEVQDIIEKKIRQSLNVHGP